MILLLIVAAMRLNSTGWFSERMLWCLLCILVSVLRSRDAVVGGGLFGAGCVIGGVLRVRQ